MNDRELTETFKEYTRKVKSAFSYAICLYNNNIISIVEFNDDGTIRAIHDNSNGYSNFKQMPSSISWGGIFVKLIYITR